MKILGLVLIILAASFFGFKLSSDLKTRLNDFNLILRMIIEITAYVKHEQLPAKRIWEELSKNDEYKKLLDKKDLDLDQISIIRELQSGLGKNNLEGQLQMLNLIKAKTEYLLDCSKKEIEAKGKLYSTMGILTGIALAVFLI